MGRDLLYKQQVIPQLPDEEEGGGKGVKAKKAGLKPAVRNLKGAGRSLPPTVNKGAVAKNVAFKAAYFNKDTSGVHQVNQSQSNMKALRGSDGAGDLRKVVLPPARGIDNPEPANLKSAMGQMGMDGSFELDLGSMLGRQNNWLQGKGVTVDMIKARMAQLEQMVLDRRRSLARMAEHGDDANRSATLHRALHSDGNAVEESEDLAAEGTELITDTVGQASGMHSRIAKMLGMKIE